MSKNVGINASVYQNVPGGGYCSITAIVPSLSRCFSITRIVMEYFESSHKV